MKLYNVVKVVPCFKGGKRIEIAKIVQGFAEEYTYSN
jgi:hypothetical protein